jgi:hypothetical protein
MLMTGLRRDAFEEVWGLPTRTYTISGDEVTKAGFTGAGGAESGFVFKGKEIYDVWEYDARGVILVFDHDRLATWKTDKTVEQLRQR